MNATLGETLSSRRRAWGLTHDEVMRATRISRQHLLWMEQDELANFPGHAYAMANIRRYCEALELDDGALEPLARLQLARLPKGHLDARVLVTPVTAPRAAAGAIPNTATAGTALTAAALVVFLIASTVTAMHIANVTTVTEPAPVAAQPLPPFAGWEGKTLLAGPGIRENRPTE